MTAEAFHRSPPPPWAVPQGRDEPLGLGLETVATLLSTAALAAAVRVLEHFAEQASDRAAESAGRWVRFRFGRRRIAAAPPVDAVEPPSAAQLAVVRQVARQTALQLRVPEEQARAIADAIVAELAVATADPTYPADPTHPADPADPDGAAGSPQGSAP